MRYFCTFVTLNYHCLPCDCASYRLFSRQLLFSWCHVDDVDCIVATHGSTCFSRRRCFKACPRCRRKVRLSPFSRRFRRQCGQGFTHFVLTKSRYSTEYRDTFARYLSWRKFRYRPALPTREAGGRAMRQEWTKCSYSYSSNCRCHVRMRAQVFILSVCRYY